MRRPAGRPPGDTAAKAARRLLSANDSVPLRDIRNGTHRSSKKGGIGHRLGFVCLSGKSAAVLCFPALLSR